MAYIVMKKFCEDERITRLKEGDKNTMYFHKIADARKRVNTIHSLNMEDVRITEDYIVHKHVDEYFNHLFGRSGVRQVSLDQEIWNEKMNLET